MALSRKTIKLLPGIFQTDANKKFLGSTLDQLVSEPNFKRVNGYIGRNFGYKDDSYVSEISKLRQNYQLEVGLVLKNKFSKVESFANYNDLINQISYFGGITSNHDRLFNNISYAYTPPVDFDKLINYRNYYWLPAGPEEIVIGTKKVYPGTTYNFIDQSYAFNIDVAGTQNNPKIVLQRGVTYTFNVSSLQGNLFIQTEPGKDGTKKYSPSVSSREVAGVSNNGSSTITFTPPLESTQDALLRYPQIDHVEYALTTNFSLLDNVIWNFGEGMSDQLDGEQFYPDNTEVIFLSTSTSNSDWTDRNGQIVPIERRSGIWRIDIVKYSGQPARVQLNYVRSVPQNVRVLINKGFKQGKEYYIPSSSFAEFKGVTAETNFLFYQHSKKDYFGEIEIIDKAYTTINVNDIIGRSTYTTPDGLKLSNGMKIKFDDTVIPSQYHNKTFIVEGVGKAIRFVDLELLIVPEVTENLVESAYEIKQFDVGKYDEVFQGSQVPDYIVMNRSSLDSNAWARINRWFHKDVIIESYKRNNYQLDLGGLQNAQRPIIEFDADLQLFNSGRVLKGFINYFFDKNFKYINRGQLEKFNNAFAVLPNIKFADLKTVGFSLQVGQTVVFGNDSSSLVKNKIYKINRLDQISSVVFDGQLSGTVTISKNRVSGVNTNFITQLEIGTDLYESNNSYIGRIAEIRGISEAYLEMPVNVTYTNLIGVKYNQPRVVLAEIDSITNYDVVVVQNGENVGKSFYFNKDDWQQGQTKTSINLPPLFDVVNNNGSSLADLYTDSSFTGTKVFSYKLGNGAVDDVLPFSLTYSNNLNLSGDIEFENNFDNDTFAYRLNQALTNRVEKSINIGYLRKITGRYSFLLTNNFTAVDNESKQYQHIRSKYDAITNYFEIGKIPTAPLGITSNLKIFLNGEFLQLTNSVNPEYRVELVGERTAVVIDYRLLVKDDIIDIFLYALQPSSFGYYEIPGNLENNPFNELISSITFGQLRNNLKKIGENSRFLIGNIFQSNNLRDISYKGIPGTILQHSASLAPAIAFLTNKQTNYVHAIDYAAKEYTRFKNRFLDAINNYLDRNINEVPAILDEILEKFSEVKNENFPFYYSDMVPFGRRGVTITNRRVTSNIQLIYNLNLTFKDEPSNIAILVYINNKILKRNIDFTITNNLLNLSNTVNLKEGDVLTIKEYTNTDGNYIPETPSKLGMYPSYVPEKFLDETYSKPFYVIQGHDGSLLPAFNDIRDYLILELETRIFNNIKVRFTESLFNRRRVIPGKYRTTSYSRAEFTSVLSLEFLKWVGENSLDYTTNSFFSANDEWSWNYREARDLDNQRVPGYWRGIYKYFFDTDRPHTHPWEMLGYSIKPNWWDNYYSWQESAKRSNLISAIVNGRTQIPSASTYLTATNSSYARPGFEKVIPVDKTGTLLSPQQILISGFDSERLSGNFTVGDYGPVESAWARSSEYVFAEQKAFALLKPAQYFGLLLDTFNYRFDAQTRQYSVKDTNLRLSFKNIIVNGETIGNKVQRASSYINWIHGYLVGLGIDASTTLRNVIDNSNFNLAYKFAGFTNKNYINVLANQISLTSKSQSLIIPEESYNIYLHKSLPVETISYSAVVIERTSRGFSVNGYDQKFPYFTIIPSQVNGTSYSLNVLDETIVLFDKFLPQKLKIPYGFEFVSLQQVADFLISYQRYLSAQGIIFDTYDTELQSVRNFSLSVQEFITWAKQGWDSGNILVLSPIVDTIHVYSENYVVDQIDNYVYGSQILGTNYNIIRNNDFSILRDSKRTTITTVSGQTIALLRLNLIQYEHVLLLDNISIFNDILYKPEVGDRQTRLKIVGSVTNSWDGELTPPGFVYSDGKVDEWQSSYDYKKGEIVQYKSLYYSALQDIEGSDSFNFNYWIRLDSSFREGLLPNLSQNAVKFSDIYDVDLLPYDENLTIYSNSLIGYRTRDYLNNLGLDPVSQIKFYQGFIKEKGTANAIRAFERGIFSNVENTIELYEEWGARLGVYGAIDNNPEYSFPIKNSLYTDNPIAYQMLDSNQEVENKLIVPVKFRDFLLYPSEYSPNIFRNRNVIEPQLWKVELFGDSVICGKKVVADRYSVRIAKRHGYSIDLTQKSSYSIHITGVHNQRYQDYVRAGEPFLLNFTSMTPNEKLFVTLETPTADEIQLSTTTYDDALQPSIVSLLSPSDLSIEFTTKNAFQKVHISIEPALYPDRPRARTQDGTYYYVDETKMGDDVFLNITSIFDTEDVYWSIEEVAINEIQDTATEGIGDINSDLVCLKDKVTGRVDEPPDFLLFKSLENVFDVAVTTRSVENSKSQDLLTGNDGVNGVWPDNIESHIVVINHGLNDARYGVPISIYKSNLIALRERLPKDKIVIWQTPVKIDVESQYTQFAPIGTNDLSLYAKAMREVSNEYGDYLADVYNLTELKNYLSLDGIHPNQEGYRLINDQILSPLVKSIIEDQIRGKYKLYEDDIQSAGFVNIDEINSQVFDIRNYATFDSTLLLNLYNGYKIWVAKDFNNNWQVYRAYISPVKIIAARSDLDNKLILVCDSAHECQIGDMIAVRGVDTMVDGFYPIFTVTETEICVIKSGIANNFAVDNRQAELIDFEKLRYSNLTELYSHVPKYGFLESDLIYVNEVTYPYSWAVYKAIFSDVESKISVDSSTDITNIYNIVGINCEIANSIVQSVDYSDAINFCVFSADESEELYYTIEDATDEDIARDVSIGGELIRTQTVTSVKEIYVYKFEVVRQFNKIVDIESINNIYLYNNKNKQILTRVDLYDPNKGRILSTAREEIDIIASRDPAAYRRNDTSSNYYFSEEIFWGQDQVGTYWWNTSNCRFVDYEQGELRSRVENWGKLFPGSTVEVYEWIDSDYLPSVYVTNGLEGTPLYANDEYYSDSVYVDKETGSFKTKYYFWVRGKTNKSAANKKKTTISIESIILDPISQGIPFMAALRDDAIALYNAGPFLFQDETTLYLSSKKLVTDQIIHSDFTLLQDGNPNFAFPIALENKLIDSVIGLDVNGSLVPDPFLSAQKKIGLGVAPNQTLIIDKQNARKNLIKYINDILIQYPVVSKLRNKSTIFSDNFFASDPEPSSTSYNVIVETKSQIYNPAQTLETLKILVKNDETLNGWGLYQRKGTVGVFPTAENTVLSLIKKQSFNVQNIWYYIDWYAPGYTSQTRPDNIVNEFKDVYKLDLTDGLIVKVNNNSNTTIRYGNIVNDYEESLGDWELYQFDSMANGKFQPRLIGLANKSIQISDSVAQLEGFDSFDFDVNVYDNRKDIELRYVFQGLKEEVFIDDLKIEYTKLLFNLINYILGEQKYIDWFFKTSFISIKHIAKNFTELASTISNYQTNIENYVNEIKPYRTKIREFISAYEKIDSYVGNITDFDIQPYYDRDLEVYRSPDGSRPEIDAVILQRPEYINWLSNYKYSIDQLVVSRPGYGYQNFQNGNVIIPNIEILRTDYSSGEEANASVIIDTTNFGISKVYMDKTGENYTQTPIVKVLGVGSRRPNDSNKFNFTVVAEGYSYSRTATINKLTFGLYGDFSRQNLLKNYSHSKISTADWTLGSGGTATFPRNGLTKENERVRDLDPWNQLNIVWETRPSGDGNADGGWNGNYFSIDPSKTYRSVVWMRRTTNDAGGVFYHGLHTIGSSNDVINIATGLNESNPYWNYRSAGNYDKDVWYLHVGYIFPSTHTGTSSHPDSGIYTRTSGRVMANNGNIADGKFPPGATQAMQRCYHYYCADPYTRGQFAYPRFEEVNGTEPSIKDLLDYGPYSDVKYKAQVRGFHMHRIRRSDGYVSFSRHYDIYSQNSIGYTGYTTTDLALDLNMTTDDHVVVVHTYDEPSINRLTNNLDAALQRCGASVEIFGKPGLANSNFKYRSSYILVGLPGCGTGRGIEHYAGSSDNSQDAFCTISFRIENGYLFPLRSDPKHYVLSTPFQLPTNPFNGTSYSYGDKTYVYNGSRWQGTKIFTSSLPGSKFAGSAVLTARLGNKTVRKIHTTLKFDRVQYTTQVSEWQPNTVVLKGAYLSYQGQAYKTTENFVTGSIFSSNNLTKVMSSSFDNANDRTMGFYVQTDDNIVPKILYQLIPGISSVNPVIVGNVSQTNDTILVGDTFGSSSGLTAGNIKVGGGKFVDRLFAHSPEELLPGAIYDSLSIRVAELDPGSVTTSTTTTTIAPAPLSIGIIGNTESSIYVPFTQAQTETSDSFAVGTFGGLQTSNTNITISVLSKPNESSVSFYPTTFDLLTGEQKQVFFRVTNNMTKGKTWFDLTTNKNDFALLDNSPEWRPEQSGHFRFNFGANINDRTSSISNVTGINTNPGGYNTVNMWMRWSSIGDANGFPMEWQTGYRLWMPGGALGFNNGSGDLYGVTPSFMSQYKGAWVFVSAVFHNTIGGSTYVGYNKLYINGMERTLSQVHLPATSGTAGIGITFANQTNPGSSDSYEFDGDISEVFVYNRELSSLEVTQLYYATKDRYPPPPTTTTSTSTSSTTTVPPPPPPPPLPPGIPASNAAWGGNGFGPLAYPGVFVGHRGGYSAALSHMGNGGGGSASPLGGAGGSWISPVGGEGDHGTGASGGGYTTSGVAGTGGLSGYNSAAVHASGIGNGGGGVETDGANSSTAPINGGNGTGGLVRITITGGTYQFTSADVTAFGASRLVSGSNAIEWDHSLSTAKRASADLYEHALIGTFTVPTGVTEITVGIIAGGGGGATGPCVNAGGGGGGAGLLTKYPVGAGTQYKVKVGAGGRGGQQPTDRGSAGGPPYGVSDAPWRGGRTSFCKADDTEIIYATGGNTRPDNCAAIVNSDSASSNTMD